MCFIQLLAFALDILNIYSNSDVPQYVRSRISNVVIFPAPIRWDGITTTEDSEMERSSHRGWFLSRPSAASCWKGKTRRRKWWKLQWRHKSVTASRITINTIVCSIALYSYVIWALGRLVSPTVRRSVQWLVWANNKNIDPHYFPFGRRNHRWPVCSPHKGTTIKSVLWHVVYSIAYSGANQRKHQSSASLAFCAGNLPVTGEFPTQRASNAGNISIWWRHHDHTASRWGCPHLRLVC